MDLKQILSLKNETDIVIDFVQKMQSIQQDDINRCEVDDDFYKTTGKSLIENRQKINTALVEYVMGINDLYKAEVDLFGLMNNIR